MLHQGLFKNSIKWILEIPINSYIQEMSELFDHSLVDALWMVKGMLRTGYFIGLVSKSCETDDLKSTFTLSCWNFVGVWQATPWHCRIDCLRDISAPVLCVTLELAPWHCTFPEIMFKRNFSPRRDAIDQPERSEFISQKNMWISSQKNMWISSVGHVSKVLVAPQLPNTLNS